MKMIHPCEFATNWNQQLIVVIVYDA